LKYAPTGEAIVVADLVRRAHPEERLLGEHERAQVQALVGAGGTHAPSTAMSAFSDSMKYSTGSSGSARRRALRCRRRPF
jgi:hypothetical protein